MTDSWLLHIFLIICWILIVRANILIDKLQKQFKAILDLLKDNE